jgi:hypothetical protein
MELNQYIARTRGVSDALTRVRRSIRVAMYDEVQRAKPNQQVINALGDLLDIVNSDSYLANIVEDA